MLYCKVSREHSPSAYLVVLDPSKLDRRIRNADALCTNFPGFDGVRFHTEAACLGLTKMRDWAREQLEAL